MWLLVWLVGGKVGLVSTEVTWLIDIEMTWLVVGVIN